MSFVVDDLGAWLVAVLADAGRKRVTDWVLGTDQERALRGRLQPRFNSQPRNSGRKVGIKLKN